MGQEVEPGEDKVEDVVALVTGLEFPNEVTGGILLLPFEVTPTALPPPRFFLRADRVHVFSVAKTLRL